jgi:serine protease Do/serine protease DegQ
MKRTASLFRAALFAALALGFAVGPAGPAAAQEMKTESRYPISSFESPFVEVAESLKPSVVYIEVVREQEVPRNPFFDFHPFFGDPDGQRREEPRTREVPSSGSGVIVDEKGHVLTNNHVVDGATEITVSLADGTKREASVLGTDRETDLALIDIGEVPADQVAPLGDSDTIRIGEWAIAMGNPLGLDWTLTVGVISAKGRANLNIAGGGPVFQNFIQTDASINFGNSGGPLANIHGEVIGINAAINARAENIGFAIPINMAKSVVEQLLDEGVVRRGYLGMVPRPLTAVLREALDLDQDVDGVFVEAVEPGTPADEGGLEASDVIVEVDGEPVSDVNDFRFRVADHAPGDRMELTVLRDDRRRQLEFTLGDRAELLAEAGQPQGPGETDAWMGLRVASLESPQARRMELEVSEGVLVVEVDEEEAARGKLRPGDVIVGINREAVEDVGDWRRLTSELAGSEKAVLISYYRQGRGNKSVLALKPED